MGEALVRTLMVVDSRVLTSGSAFQSSWLLSGIAYLCHNCYGKVSLKVIGVFFKQNVWAAEAASSVTVTVSLTPTKSESEARVQREDVCVALVKLTLETLFLVLSEIVSSCFLFNCLLSALHVVFFFFSFFSLFAFHLCPFPFPPWCTKADPTGGRQTLFPCLVLPGGTPTPRPGEERPLLAVIY